jgi:hypothetical protein
VAEAVVGTGKEVESQPAVSVWLASLETRVRTFHCEFRKTDGDPAFSGWPEDPAGGYLLIADPFSFPVDLLRSAATPTGRRPRRACPQAPTPCSATTGARSGPRSSARGVPPGRPAEPKRSPRTGRLGLALPSPHLAKP